MKLKSKFLQESEMQLSLTKTPEDDAVVLWSAKESVYKIQEHQSPNLKDDILIFKKEQSLCAKSNRENQIAQILFYTHPDFVLTSATYYPIEI
jgi:phosphopantetheinyl transferase (holo-ACP synthase)